MHQPSGLSVNAAPFQLWASMPALRLAEVPRDLPEAGRKGSLNGHSPPGRTTTSSVGMLPSPMGGPYPPTSDDDVTSDGGLVNPSSHRKEKRSRGSRGSQSGEGSNSSHPVRSSTSSRGRRKKKDGFLVKSKSQSLVGGRVIQGRSLMPSSSGRGASPTTETTMRTLT